MGVGPFGILETVRSMHAGWLDLVTHTVVFELREFVEMGRIFPGVTDLLPKLEGAADGSARSTRLATSPCLLPGFWSWSRFSKLRTFAVSSLISCLSLLGECGLEPFGLLAAR